MSSIDRESEDIFAEEEESDNEESSNGELDDEDCGELTAAAALTTLVSVTTQRSEGRVKGGGANGETVELEIPQRFTKSGRKRAVSFPLKLMKVLSTKKHADVISWTPSGKAFEIRKPKQFVADILPKYFKGAKYSSFTRKLHRWNFQRHYRGEEAGAFYHKDFMKDRMDLVEQMTCKHENPSSAPKPALSALKKSKRAASATGKKAPPASVTARSVPNKPATVVTVNASNLIRNYSSIARAPTAVEPATAVDLNAAIEMEVTRRLEERISAAAFSRQALAMMEQQQKQQQQIQASLNALLEQRYQALVTHQSNLMGSSIPPPQGPLHLSNVHEKFKPMPSFNYAFGDNTQVNLPPTNIQGARTA